jgi:hypothetical protein
VGVAFVGLTGVGDGVLIAVRSEQLNVVTSTSIDSRILVKVRVGRVIATLLSS